MVVVKHEGTGMNVSSPIYKSHRITVKPIDLLVFAVSGLTGFLFIICNTVPSNRIMVILPLIYAFGYLFLLSQAIRMRRSKTTMLFAACEFLRMVVLVFITGYTNQYGFNAFQTNDSELLTTATLLIAYEFIIGSLVVYIYSVNHSSRESEDNTVSVSYGEKIGIFLVIVSAIVLYLAFPGIRKQINFLSLDAGEEKVRATTTGAYSSMMVLLMNYIHYAYLCIFIIAASWASKKYNKGERYFYYLFSIIIGLIVVATIFGESRATLVYTAFAVLACLSRLFPKYRRRTVLWVIAGMAAVIAGMTIYRLFIVYRYSSYSNAIAAGPRVRDNYYIYFLESYLLGPQSVAAGVKLGKSLSSRFTLARLIFDFLRPCMGFNVLLKNTSIDMSTTLYNSMLYGTTRSNGFFLQITAQGYCYFGFAFAPIFLVLFLLLAFRFEKWIKQTNSLFVFFFLNYIHIRLATVVLGGTMSGFITTTSMLVLIMGLFWLIQRFTRDSIEKRIN